MLHAFHSCSGKLIIAECTSNAIMFINILEEDQMNGSRVVMIGFNFLCVSYVKRGAIIVNLLVVVKLSLLLILSS